jgi:ABC-type lipoprotein release transport system permease subunit
MILKTAWKNVWRNRVRSLVVIASVTMGVFAAVFSIAFMNGMIAQRFDAAIDQEISHIQVNGESFRLNNDPLIFVPDIDKTTAIINSTPGIAGNVKRIITGGMAVTAAKSAGVEIIGIDPVADKSIFSLNTTIIDGTGGFFKSESRYDQVLIGQDLAKELGIIRFIIDSAVLKRLGEEGIPGKVTEKLASQSGIRFSNEKKFNKAVRNVLSKKEAAKYFYRIKAKAWSYREGSGLTLTLLDKDNNQVDSRFRVSGIYDTKNSMFEMSNVFVEDETLRRFTGFGENEYHQVIARLDDIEQTERVTAELKQKLPGVEVVNWKELQPDLAMMTEYVHQIYGILMVIIMAALAFGIVNTMLMAVLERTKELGMLAAIGMNRRKIFSMIMLESVFLSVIGGIAGMIVASVAILLTAKNGINFLQYAEGMEAWGYTAHIFPEIDATFFIMMTVLVILTGIFSSVYPAMKALKLNPVEAIRTE